MSEFDRRFDDKHEGDFGGWSKRAGCLVKCESYDEWARYDEEPDEEPKSDEEE